MACGIQMKSDGIKGCTKPCIEHCLCPSHRHTAKTCFSSLDDRAAAAEYRQSRRYSRFSTITEGQTVEMRNQIVLRF